MKKHMVSIMLYLIIILSITSCAGTAEYSQSDISSSSSHDTQIEKSISVKSDEDKLASENISNPAEKHISMDRYRHIEVENGVEHIKWHYGAFSEHDIGLSLSDYEQISFYGSGDIEDENEQWQIWQFYLEESGPEYAPVILLVAYDKRAQIAYELGIPLDYSSGCYFVDDSILFLEYFNLVFDLDHKRYHDIGLGFQWNTENPEQYRPLKLIKNGMTGEYLLLADKTADDFIGYMILCFDSNKTLKNITHLEDAHFSADYAQLSYTYDIAIRWKDHFAVIYDNYISFYTDGPIGIFTVDTETGGAVENYDASWVIKQDIDDYLKDFSEGKRDSLPYLVFSHVPFRETTIPYMLEQLKKHDGPYTILENDKFKMYYSNDGRIAWWPTDVPGIPMFTREALINFELGSKSEYLYDPIETVLGVAVAPANNNSYLLICLTDYALYCAPFNPLVEEQNGLHYESNGEYSTDYFIHYNTNFYSNAWIARQHSVGIFTDEYKNEVHLVAESDSVKLYDNKDNYLFTIWQDGNNIYNIAPDT